MRNARKMLPVLLVAVVAAMLLPLAALAQDEAATPAATGDGVITGSIRFNGTPPESEKLEKDKDPDVCGTGIREIINVKVGADGRLGNVVVCIDEGSEGEGHFEKPEAGYYKLNQKGCAFLPEVFVVPKGEKLRITNRDPIIHNIHTYERIKRVRKDLFRFPQPERGHRRTETIEPKRSSTIELTCDIHSFMHGWMYASDGSSCTVSDDGGFKINGVADGVHTIKVWHPTLGEQEAEVTVNGGDEASVDFEYPLGD